MGRTRKIKKINKGKGRLKFSRNRNRNRNSKKSNRLKRKVTRKFKNMRLRRGRYV